MTKEELKLEWLYAEGVDVANEFANKLNVDVESFKLCLGWNYNDEGYDWGQNRESGNTLVNGKPLREYFENEYDHFVYELTPTINKYIELFITAPDYYGGGDPCTVEWKRR